MGLGLGLGLASRRGGGSRWSPARHSPSVWIEPSISTSKFWWDSSRTKAAGEGGVARVLDDLTANAAHATAASDSQRGTVYTDDPFSGIPSVAFVPASSNSGIYSYYNGTLPNVGAAYTVALLVRPNPTHGTSGDSLANGQAAAGGHTIGQFFQPSSIGVRMSNAAGTSFTAAGGTRPDIRGTWAGLVATFDGTTLSGWCNGVSMGTVTVTGTVPTTDQYRLGATSGGADGDYALWLVIPSCLTGGALAALLAYLAAKIAAASLEIAAVAASPSSAGGLVRAWDSTAAGVLTLSGSAASPGGTCDSWAPSTGSDTLVKPADRSAPDVVTDSSTTVVSFTSGGTQTLGKAYGVAETVNGKTWYVVAKRLTLSAEMCLLHYGPTQQEPTWMWVKDQGSSSRDYGGVYGGSTMSANNAVRALSQDGLWHVYCFSSNGWTQRLFVDGVEYGYSNGTGAIQQPGAILSGAATWTQTGLAVGAGRTAGEANPNLRVAGVYEHSQAHGSRTVRQVTEYLRGTQFPNLFSGYDSANVVAWVGASNLGGSDTSIPALAAADAGNTKYTRWFVPWEGSFFTQYSRGRMRAHREFSRWTTGKRVACVYTGGNDLASMSLATVEAVSDRLFRELKGRGEFDYVVVGTQLPRTSVVDADRASYNTWLGTQVGVTIDAVADQASNSFIGDDGDNADATYYADGVHLTAAGRAVAAAYWVTAIQGVLP